MNIQTETFVLPSCWASYLINGDSSGLEEPEISECDAFLSRHPELYCASCSEEFFSGRNDAGTLAGTCCEFTFIYR